MFLHYVFFIDSIDDKTTASRTHAYYLLEEPERRWLLTTFMQHGVTAVFSGHAHRNYKVLVHEGTALIITGGPAMRVVKVYADRIAYDQIIGNEFKSCW